MEIARPINNRDKHTSQSVSWIEPDYKLHLLGTGETLRGLGLSGTTGSLEGWWSWGDNKTGLGTFLWAVVLSREAVPPGVAS